MAWTTPRTWTPGELVTALMMNLHIRDNLTYLYNLITGLVAAFVPLIDVNDFRLTSQSGTSVGGGSASGTIYCTTHKGNRMSLYSGSAWETLTSAEFSLALSGGTASKLHDVFAYNNAGVPTLEIVAWTNDTTRATALTVQDGRLVKSGAVTRRFLGTIYLNGSKQITESTVRLDVWNYDNRIRRVLRALGSGNYTYTTDTLRQVNASSANQVDFVIGIDEDAVTAVAGHEAEGTAGVIVTTAIGLDSTSAVASGCLVMPARLNTSSYIHPCFAHWDGRPGIGKHFLAWLERSTATGTTTWHGTVSSTSVQSGLSVVVFA